MKYDPGNEHAINYMWGTTGIGYNVEKIKEIMPDAPLDSWDMIFKPEIVSKFADCGIFVLDTPDEMIPAALNYLGLDPDSKDPDEIEKAGELLLVDPPEHPQVPFLRIYQRARQRRHLPGRRLVGRYPPGARPRGGGRQRRDGRIRHPEGRRADVVRQYGDPGRRPARRGSARVPEFHHASRK